MIKKINVDILTWDTTPVSVIEKTQVHVNIPEKCPYCDITGNPDIVHASCIPCDTQSFSLTYSPNTVSSPLFLSVVLICPSCKYMFFSTYIMTYQGCVQNLEVLPLPRHVTKFGEEITTLSPNFVKIYHQAELAESKGLTDICGMGYRKSLEFLVKDYCKQKSPNDIQEIESAPLAQIIKQIDDYRIQTLFSRAAWIGNDECHYLKLHTDKDISDMKNFIRTAIHFIEDEKILEAASAMKSKPKR